MTPASILDSIHHAGYLLELAVIGGAAAGLVLVTLIAAFREFGSRRNWVL